MSKNKCQYCGRSNAQEVELCASCGAPMDHQRQSADGEYFGTYEGKPITRQELRALIRSGEIEWCRG